MERYGVGRTASPPAPPKESKTQSSNHCPPRTSPHAIDAGLEAGGNAAVDHGDEPRGDPNRPATGRSRRPRYP